MKKFTHLLLLSAAAVSTSSADVLDVWPAFRGPNSSGVSQTAHPPVEIGPDENVEWSVDLPWSPSSPIVWGSHLFLTTIDGEHLETRAYESTTGKLIWKRQISTKTLEDFHATEGSPAASSPATDGKHVVSYFGSFGLICHDFDGDELWRRQLPVANTSGAFGTGTSPLIADELVIVNRDLIEGSSILALRLKDGSTAWETARPDNQSSYGTPIISTLNGAAEVIMSGSIALRSYDLKSGVENWMIRGLPSYVCTTPVIGEDMIFFAGWSPGKADSPWPSWEGVVSGADKNDDGVITLDEFAQGPAWFKSQDIDGDGKLEREDWETIGNLLKRGDNVALGIRPGGKGDISEKAIVWSYGRGLPYVPSPLYYMGRVYLVRDGGMMTCFDARSGAPIFEQERLKTIGSYYSSPVAADGRIYVASLTGKFSVVKAGESHPEILHQSDFDERIASSPALVGDRLYLRTETKLYSFK